MCGLWPQRQDAEVWVWPQPRPSSLPTEGDWEEMLLNRSFSSKRHWQTACPPWLNARQGLWRSQLFAWEKLGAKHNINAETIVIHGIYPALEIIEMSSRKDLRVNLVRLTHVTGDGTEKQRDSWTAMSEATQCHRPRQMKHPDSQAKALSPTSPPSTPGKCTQTSSLLSKACSWALYCWHFLWQVSVTTKGYTVNARGQILKLAYFHNHHFLRGEGPFSGSLKTSGF